MIHQHVTLEDTVYFWVGTNDTTGSGADLDSGDLDWDVRLAGAAADAAPVLSGTGSLLSHANYPPGCYEIAVAATTANGFAAGNTYAVFATGLVDSKSPTGFVGSFKLGPIPADIIQIKGGATAAANLKTAGDNYSVTRGLVGTALPAVAAGANGGLPLQGSAIPNANADAAGGLPTTTKITDARLGVLTDWIDDGRLDLLLDAVKAVTDVFRFTANDVKATLDGEEVVTDAASRTASKADVSALALEATLTAIKGAGWTAETLEALADAIAAIPTNPYTGTPPTADAIGTDAASKVLATPANKLATDGTGRVTAGAVSDKTGFSLTAAYDPAKTAAQAGDAMTLEDAAITAAKFAADAIAAASIAAAAANKIADHVRRRTQANVEASSDGDALDLSSHYGAVQQQQEANTADNAGKLTVYRTDGTTQLGQLTLATDAAAEPVTGMS